MLPMLLCLVLLALTLVFAYMAWSQRSSEMDTLQSYRRARRSFQHPHPYLPQPPAEASTPGLSARLTLNALVGRSTHSLPVSPPQLSENWLYSYTLSPEETSARSIVVPVQRAGSSTTPAAISSSIPPLVLPERSSYGRTEDGASGDTGTSTSE
jgi:hypothetical protein